MLTIREIDIVKLPIHFRRNRRIHHTHRAAARALIMNVSAYTVPDAKISGVKAETMPRKKQLLTIVHQSPFFFFSWFMPRWIFSTANRLTIMPDRMQILMINMTAPNTEYSAFAAISPTEA